MENDPKFPCTRSFDLCLQLMDGYTHLRLWESANGLQIGYITGIFYFT